MKKSIDLRRRVGTLIGALQEIPPRHRTPAMENLLSALLRAAAEYDGEPEDDRR
jgi:hypothetical protein